MVAAISFQLAACGTILHPERKGQTDGSLDPVIAVMDGIGLIFFVIPGVIAYAVDFSNGTIYLPKTEEKKASSGLHGFRVVKFDAKHGAPAQLKSIILRKTGCDFNWRDPRLLAVRLKNKAEMASYLAQAQTSLMARR